jgi:hypothetical protein
MQDAPTEMFGAPDDVPIRMIGTETTENRGRIVLLPVVLLPADTGLYITANRTIKPSEMSCGTREWRTFNKETQHQRAFGPAWVTKSLQVIAKVDHDL